MVNFLMHSLVQTSWHSFLPYLPRRPCILVSGGCHNARAVNGPTKLTRSPKPWGSFKDLKVPTSHKDYTTGLVPPDYPQSKLQRKRASY